MAVRRIVVVCAAVLLAGCGTKPSQTTATESPRPALNAGTISPAPDKKKDSRETPAPKPDTPKVTPPQPETPKVDVDGLIAEMKANAGRVRSDSNPGAEALKRLTDAVPPTHPRRADVYKALSETADRVTVSDVGLYLPWLAKYAGTENAAAMLALARRNTGYFPEACEAAFARLAEIKDPATIAPIAAMLGDAEAKVRAEAAKALKQIGAPAEKVVQSRAAANGPDGKSNDAGVRRAALEILAAVGTADSLPLLESLAKDAAVAEEAKKAAAAIKSRAK